MDKIIYKKSLEFVLNDKVLKGIEVIPYNAKEMVIFSHGSGSSRFSPKNNFISDTLNKENYATLQIDLLTSDEQLVFKDRYDIELLTDRLVNITQKISRMRCTDILNIGYFGVGIGTATALNAAATLGPDFIKAIVSMGGRPDLSLNALKNVKAPVLLIAPDKDTENVKLNRLAFTELISEKKLIILPETSQKFSEPGSLDIVAGLADAWFDEHLTVKHSIAPAGDLMYPFPWS